MLTGFNNIIVGTGRGGQVFWYERHSPTEWTRHLIADGFVEVEGTIAADFNNVGRVIRSGLWPRTLRSMRELG